MAAAPEDNFGLYTIILIGVLLLHQVLSYLLESRKFHYLDESGLAMIIGAIVSVFAFLENPQLKLPFSKDFFFYVLVPILFYSEAYNMQKRYFFKYSLYIFCFGVLGTFINVNLIFLFTYMVNNLGYILLNGDVITLTGDQMIQFSILMTSLECVVGKTTVNKTYRPKLHSVLFGEELMNEVTVYSLFVSYLTLVHFEGGKMSVSFYYKFVGLAVVQFLLSLLFGLVMGIIFTVISKLLVNMLKSSVAVTVYVLYVGYLTYSISKQLHQPGAVTIFVIGMIFSHYLTYNVPQKCFEASRHSLKTLAYCSETFIFVYLGMSFTALFFQQSGPTLEVSWTFLLMEIFIVFVCRIICFTFIVSLIFIFQIKNVDTFRISFPELAIICISGVVRGSVSFALFQYIIHDYETKGTFDPVEENQIQVIKSSVLILIIGSNLIFGFLMPYIAVACFNKIRDPLQDEERVMIRRGTLTQLFGEDYKEKQVKLKIDTKAARIKIFFKNLDENYFKPLMIYNYKNRKDELRKQKKRMNLDQKLVIDERIKHHRSHSDEIKITPTILESQKSMRIETDIDISVLSVSEDIEVRINPADQEMELQKLDIEGGQKQLNKETQSQSSDINNEQYK